MLHRLLILVAVLASCAYAATPQQQRTWKEQKYSSPDGALIAKVRSSKTPGTIEESEVRVTTARGKLLSQRSYASKDGEHGYGVFKAQWTPNSQYFVFSLQSSGGHQPWHSPVQYFSRKSSAFVSLDELLKDAVSDPQFRIDPPDRVTVELYSSRKVKSVSLSSLSKSRNETAQPGSHRVTGYVLDDDGRPISAEVSAWVISKEGTAGDTHWIATDEQGRFELSLFPGSYELRAKNSDALYADPSLLFGHRASNPATKVEVFNREISNVELRPRNRGFLLRGDVVDADGKPVESAKVTITDASNPAGKVIVYANKNGDFQIVLPAVRFFVEAQAAGLRTTERDVRTYAPKPGENVAMHLKLARN